MNPDTILAKINLQIMERTYAMQTSPITAHAAGLSYSGENMPDKGKKNGSCNRTACQMPLTGQKQFWMVDHNVVGSRLYYCGACEQKFRDADRQFQPSLPFRCNPDEDN